jgi:hypothetical protein
VNSVTIVVIIAFVLVVLGLMDRASNARKFPKRSNVIDGTKSWQKVCYWDANARKFKEKLWINKERFK